MLSWLDIHVSYQRNSLHCICCKLITFQRALNQNWVLHFQKPKRQKISALLSRDSPEAVLISREAAPCYRPHPVA